jgi:putative ABC transport system permease protein
VSFSINPRLIGYSSDRSKRLFENVGRELREVSGVSALTMAKLPMLTGTMDISGYEMVDGSVAAVSQNYVGAGFFGSIGMPLVSGREFGDFDGVAGAPGVAIVNEEFVRRFLPDRNPVGVRLNTRRAKKPLEIVGVVKDAKSDDLKARTKPFVYLPAAQDGAAGPMTFYVRTRLDPRGLANSIRTIVGRLDGTLPVSGPQTVRQQIEDSVFLDRMISALALVFAAIATTLAAIGLYGVVAWAVARRRREIGIRMALGAAPRSIVRMVLTEVAGLAAVGVGIAIPLWVGSGRLVHSLLFGVTERDPSAFVLAVAVLAGDGRSGGHGPGVARVADRPKLRDAERLVDELPVRRVAAPLHQRCYRQPLHSVAALFGCGAR